LLEAKFFAQPIMNKEQFRQRAYRCYASGFKQAVTTSNAGDSVSATRYRGYLRRHLSPWLQDVPRTAVVADLGCGDGMLLRVFRELGFAELHGVEGSAEMAELCRRHFPEVEQGDLRDYLRRKPGAFEVIALFDVLEHFTREEAVELLDEIHAALRPGGLLLLQLPNGDSPFAGGVFAADVTHETLYTKGSLGHLLAIGGFELSTVEEHSAGPSDLRSAIRWAGWKIMRGMIGLGHRIETGGASSGIYTRVMRAMARKRGTQCR
jgi:SAM-dependent methyltransferase